MSASKIGLFVITLLLLLISFGCVGSNPLNEVTTHHSTSDCISNKDSCESICQSTYPDSTEREGCNTRCDGDYYICRGSAS